VAEGAKPLKPLNVIPSAVILITKTVVAGFRGEKMSENVSERFWKMDNRFWIIDDPEWADGTVGSIVIGFMAKEELCCDGAKPVFEHTSREVDMEEIAEILGTHSSALLWDLHTRDTLLMTKRTS